MSAGGGATNSLLISPAKKLVVVLTVAVFVIGPSDTAGFAKSLITAIGYAVGFVVGGIPTMFESVKSGQAKMGGGSAPAIASPPKADKAPANPDAPKAEGRNSTGNQKNDGTD
jgi:hypothetical protein